MKLIVNADDFGYSRAVNFGIVDAFKLGIVRSTTLMTNMPGFDHAIELAKENPDLGLGIHLVLTTGLSLTHGKTISDSSGAFLKQQELLKRLEQNEINLTEIEQEYEAQIEKAFRTGVKITHFDSHHHIHMNPVILPIFLKISKKYDVAVRMFQPADLLEGYHKIIVPAAFSQDFYGENATSEGLIKELELHKNFESFEVMCHPAYLDETILSGSSYNTARTKELSVLMSPGVLEYISEQKIELINFAGL